MSEGLVPYRYKSGKYSVRCQVDGAWFDYKLRDDEIVYRETPPASSHESHESLLTRIIEIENRIAKLESKTAELPEKDGIEQLKAEMKGDFTGFLAETLKQGDTGAAYG
jgi:hypothetical protein